MKDNELKKNKLVKTKNSSMEQGGSKPRIEEETSQSSHILQLDINCLGISEANLKKGAK